MMQIIEKYRPKFDDSIKHLQVELAGLRSGRATPAMVEGIMVEAYGSKQPIKAIASIMVSDPKTIVVQPWDKSIVQSIERGILESNIGINPVVDGAIIRLPFPQLTEESRKEIVKTVRHKLEETRIAVRNIRDSAKEEIILAEKNKEIGEDERFTLQEKLDNLVKDLNEKVKKIGEEKEQDVMRL